jgi:DNA-binding NarL/FixJ family response regulator
VGWTGASPLRVIVADGDASVRQQIRYALDATPDLELIATARDGPEAWSSALELRPDVLVLDARLPIVDGRSVLMRLRTEAPDIRIVMYVESSAACRDAVDLGASGCVRKNAPLDILLSAIRASDPRAKPRVPRSGSDFWPGPE